MTEEEYNNHLGVLIFDLGHCKLQGDQNKIVKIMANIARLELVKAIGPQIPMEYKPIPYD